MTDKSNQTRGLKSLGTGDYTPEEEFAIRSKGGKKSCENRRLKKQMRTVCVELLESVPDLDKATVANLKALGIKGKGKEKNQYNVLIIATAALLQKAMRGDTKAFRLITELVGEDPHSRSAAEKLNLERELLLAGKVDSEDVMNDDGFMAALNAAAEREVFSDGADEPEHIE